MKRAAIIVVGTLCLILAGCGQQPVPEASALAGHSEEQEVDLEMPKPADHQSSTTDKLHPPQEPDRASALKEFDPLLVRNIDVVDPLRREYIESLKLPAPVNLPDGLEIDGVVVTSQWLPVFDDNGKPVLDIKGRPLYERQMVYEYTFKDHKRSYRAGDKVEGTDWVIPNGWVPMSRIKLGDAGIVPGHHREDGLPPGYMPPAMPQPQ